MAEGHGEDRGSHVLELPYKTVFLIVTLAQTTTARFHSEKADLALGPTGGDEIVLGMPRQANQGIAGLIDVVDELASGGIDQLRCLVAADGSEAQAVIGERRAENPVEMVVTTHQFLSIRYREDTRQFVCTTDSYPLIVGCDRDAEEGVVGSLDGTDEDTPCGIPNLNLTKF